MVELKEKTVEELRKMASRKKIEGRSKMNKAELIKALKKTSSSKKTMKRRIMRGGALTEEQIQMLVNRDYTENPMFIRYMNRNGDLGPEIRIQRVVRGTGYNTHMIGVYEEGNNLNGPISKTTTNWFTIDGDTLICDGYTEIRGRAPPSPPRRYSAPVLSNRVNINATNPVGVSTHNDGKCSLCLESTRYHKANGTPFNEAIDVPSNKIEYTNDERKAMLRKLRPCGHVFHRNCIDIVARGPVQQRVCPLCRKPFIA